MKTSKLCKVLALAGLFGTFGIAQAEERFYWDPTVVQAGSQQFLRVAEFQQERVDAAEEAMVKVDRGLEGATIGVALGEGIFSTQACAASSAKLDALLALFELRASEIQATVDDWAEQARQAFLDAVSRALFAEAASQGVDRIQQCDSGPFKGRGPMGSCTGQDVSESVRARIDGDTELNTKVEAILATPPTLTTASLPQETLPTCGEGKGWVDPSRLVDEVLVLGQLKRRLDAKKDTVYQDSVGALRDKVKGGADPAQRAVLIAEVQESLDAQLEAVDAQWGRIGQVLVKRLKGVAICPFGSKGWGGCAGEDRTDAFVDALSADRSLVKQLKKALPPDLAPQ